MLLKALNIILLLSLNSHSDSKLANISIDTFFTQSEKSRVVKGEIINRSYLNENEAGNTSNNNNIINIPVTKYTPANLRQYEMICIEKAFFPYSLNSKSGLSFYNMLVSPSKLSGMKYYSVTDKKIQPFITKSSSIASPGNKKELKDPNFSLIRPEYSQFFKITDNRFGEIIFRSKLYNSGDTFVLNNVSVQPMKKYMLTINKKKEYRLISFFFYDTEAGGFFYYSLQAMRIRTNYFLKLGLLNKESFANRIRAGTVHMAGLLGLDWSDKLNASLIR